MAKKNAVSAKCARLLRKVTKYILAEPSRYDQTASQISRLFAYIWNEETCWPNKFKAAYEAAKSPAARAKVAARRIEHFIKTGE